MAIIHNTGNTKCWGVSNRNPPLLVMEMQNHLNIFEDSLIFLQN